MDVLSESSWHCISLGLGLLQMIRETVEKKKWETEKVTDMYPMQF